MAKTNSGHYLEKAVEDELSLIAETSFNWIRLPDAKAARGFLAAQPADFFMAQSGRAMYLECKSVGGKTYRLPKFDQHSRMLRWEQAGIKGYVLVHFHEPDVLMLVRVTNLEPGKASWVIRNPKLDSVKEAIETLRRLV